MEKDKTPESWWEMVSSDGPLVNLDALLFGQMKILLLLFSTLLALRYISLRLPVFMTIYKTFRTVRIVANSYRETITDGEKVGFKSRDGLLLEGIFLKSVRGSKRTIIFSHEVGAGMHSLLKYGWFLTQHGFHVFTFDYRGHGSSTDPGYVLQQWVTSKEVDDLLGAIDYVLTREEVDAERVGLFGISRGAGAAICAAVQLRNIKAIVCDSPFATHQILEFYTRKWTPVYLAKNPPPSFMRILCRVHNFLTLKASGWRLGCRYPSIQQALAQCFDKSILFVFGEEDKFIPFEVRQELFSKSSGEKQLWEVPGAGHNQSVLVRPDEYHSRICQFFDENV